MDQSDDNSNIEELIFSEEEDLPMETVEMEESVEEHSSEVITGELPTSRSFVSIKPSTSQNPPVQLKTIIAGKGQPSVSAQMQKLMGRQVTIVSKSGASTVQGSSSPMASGTKLATSSGQKIALQPAGKKIITISPAQAQQLKLMSTSGSSPQYLTKVKTLPTTSGQKILVKSSSAGATGKISGTFIDMAGVQKQVVVNPPTILNVAASPSARPPPAVKTSPAAANKVQVVRLINPKTQQQSLQKFVIAQPQKVIKTEGGSPASAAPPKLVIQGKNGQCFYVATSPNKQNIVKYSSPVQSRSGANPTPVSKIVLDKDKLKVVFPEPTILNSSVSSTSKSFPVHIYTSKTNPKLAGTTVTNVRNFTCSKPLSMERKVDTREKVNIEKLLEGSGLGEDTSKRRPCNCTRSQCLKLYCECFANGEFCKNCNCKECYNSLEHEDERQKAIRLCLDRNPNAFRPKISKFSTEDAIRRQHNKGCNCKRSGCLKNYCECYEYKISCSANCKCFGCRNVDGYFPANADDSASSTMAGVKRPHMDIDPQQVSPRKQACNFMTPDVVEASIQCMIAQADDCQKSKIAFHLTEKMILEEFGRCLAEIIDFSFNNDY